MLIYFCDKATLAAYHLAEALKPAKNLPLKIYLVSQQAHRLENGDFQLLTDADGSFSRSYSAQPGTLYLIRPDGHIAARGFDFPLEKLAETLDRASGHQGMETNLLQKS